MSTTGKTPVSLLNEMLVRKRLQPMYNLLMSGVGSNQGQFVYEVTAGTLVKARGGGRSKKEAKQDAAKVALDMLKNQLAEGTVSLDTSQDEDTIKMPSLDVISPYESQLRDNSVGTLNELCAMTQLPMPKFSVIREDGPPHAKLFEIACQVSNFEHCGVARTKQQAKHLAAKLMVEMLENLRLVGTTPPVSVAPAESGESAEEREQLMLDIHAARAKHSLAAAPRSSLLGVQMGSRIKHEWTKEKLQPAQELRHNASNDHLVQLQNICKELDLDLSFSNINSNNENVKLVVLSVSLRPQNSFLGRGCNVNAAHNDAASNALLFFDLMVF